MSLSKITLNGCIKYFDYRGDDLFKNMSLPSGIDKDTLTSNIILRGGEFEIMYPNAEFMQEAIGVWSTKWNRTITKWIAALNIEYEPLYNYDRTETYTGTNIDETSHSGSNTHTENGTVNESSGQDSSRDVGDVTKSGNIEQSGTNTTTTDNTNKVSAFNSSTMQNDTSTHNVVTDEPGQKETYNDVTDHTDDTVTTTYGRKDTRNITYTDTNGMTDTHDTKENHTLRAFGNIGVTSSQQLLMSEIEVAKWNLYEHVTDIFLQEFVIPVY